MKDNLSDYERYLKPVHLKGKEVTLTIVKFTEEETHPQRGQVKMALVAWFRELPFGLILSPINRQTLQDTCDSLAGWIGKPITVKSVPIGKVGPTLRSPIRIVNTLPAAPALDNATGELVHPSPVGEGRGEVGSELDAHFGPSPLAAQHPLHVIEVLPETEAQFTGWLKAHNWNGQEVHSALGTGATSWLRSNPGKTWADICQIITSLKEQPA